MKLHTDTYTNTYMPILRSNTCTFMCCDYACRKPHTHTHTHSTYMKILGSKICVCVCVCVL